MSPPSHRARAVAAAARSRPQRARRARTGVALALLLALLSGCGDESDSGPGAAGQDTPQGPGSGGDPSDPDAPPEPDEPADDAATDAADDDTGGAGGGGTGDTRTALALGGEPPPEVVIDERYVFTPETRGTGGADPTYSVTNLPHWAHFDPDTGRLEGTPEAGDESRYADIRITARAGGERATLPAFSIEVVTTGRYSVELAWTPPDERVDGSALGELGGYRIYRGRARDDIDRRIVLDNPGLSRYTVPNLARGRWYFQLTAVDAAGLESARSAAVSARAR